MFYIFAENSCMNLKIKILVLLITLFLFGGCSSEVNYSSQIINYDFNQLDGVLIYNRDICKYISITKISFFINK